MGTMLCVLPAGAEEKRIFVVLDLSAPPVMLNLGRTLSAIVVSEARNMGTEVLDTRDLVEKLGKEGAAKATACGTDPTCLGNVLADVGAHRVISGTFNKTSTHYQVRMVHVDLATRQVVSRLERDILIASRALPKDVKAAVPALLKGEPEKMGLLHVQSTTGGAEIRIDGVMLGLTPEATFKLKPGKHEVKVTLVDHLPVERFVDITADETTQFEARLFLIPGRKAPSVVAAAAGVEDGKTEAPKGFDLPIVSWIAGGVGIAALGSASFMGLRAGAIEDDARDVDGDGILDITRDRALKGEQATKTANILFAVAGGAVITAVVIAIVSGDSPASAGGEGASVGAVPLQDGAMLVVGGRF